MKSSTTSRRWASNRKSSCSDIGILESIPYEITMYKILGFLSPRDLFSSIQLVNVFFHKLLWVSLRNSKRFSEEIIIIPSRIEAFKNYTKGYGQYYSDKSIRSNFMDLHFTSTISLFIKLCHCGAINLDKCAYGLIDYFFNVIRLSRWYSFSTLEVSEGKSIINAIQTVMDCFDERIEDSDIKLENSFFHKSFSGCCSHPNGNLLKFFLLNGDKFRIPTVDESVRYLNTKDLVRNRKEIVEFMKHYEYLIVSQELFEAYFRLRFESVCWCCDNCVQMNDLIEPFLGYYFRRYSSKETNKDEEGKKNVDEKIIPNKVVMTIPLVKEIIYYGWKRRHYKEGEKLKLVIRFIEEFGLYDNKEEDEDEEESAGLQKVGNKETEEFLENLRKEIKDAERFENDNRITRDRYVTVREKKSDIFQDKLEKESESWCGKEEKLQRRNKVVNQIYLKRFCEHNQRKVIRRRRKKRVRERIYYGKREMFAMTFRRGKRKKMKSRVKRRRRYEVRKRACLPVSDVMCF